METTDNYCTMTFRWAEGILAARMSAITVMYESVNSVTLQQFVFLA